MGILKSLYRKNRYSNNYSDINLVLPAAPVLTKKPVANLVLPAAPVLTKKPVANLGVPAEVKEEELRDIEMFKNLLIKNPLRNEQ
jgi:hypothetical protein